ncbi:MAG TPA: hypothetical protein VGS20_00975 [Candidatus Acidoferrales bacterium]|nr:hypothetical protein [Candidatus Acidoferrales bacterium]
MPAAKPTHAQAQLQLQLYDLRRETKIREARDWFAQNCFIDNIDDLARLAPPGSKENTFINMVVGYWDQACALLNHGLLHEQLFFETNGEFYFVWDRIKPAVAPLRDKYHMKHWVVNLEKAASRYEKWMERQSPGVLESMREFGKQMRAARAQRAPAAKAAGAD